MRHDEPQHKELHSEPQPHDAPAPESVQVIVGESGAPVELRWGNTSYRVVSRPILWVKRERWWEHRQPLQEIPVWRFTAVAVEPPSIPPSQIIHMEVARLSNPQRWQLIEHQRVEPTAEP